MNAERLQQRPSRKEIETLKGLLASHCGLCFKEKENILLRQTTERMETVKITSLGEYLFYLFERGDDELHQLVNLLTINETYFYRHADQIALLRETAEEMVRREPYGKFRVWSAGCSIGAEPYTLAIALQDIVQRTGADIKIIATDIDSEVLAKAEFAVYSKRQVTAEMPPELLERHFSLLPDGNYRIADELKQLVTFKKHNLKKDIYPEQARLGGVDIIFCRNVLIYFEPRTRDDIIRRLHAALRPGGVLFLSPVESLPEFRVYFTEVLGKDGVKCYRKWTTDRRDEAESVEQSEKRRPLETNPYPSVERHDESIAISGVVDGSERIEMISNELLLALGKVAAEGRSQASLRFSLDLTNLLYITNEGLAALYRVLAESRRRGIRVDCIMVAGAPGSGERMIKTLELAGFRAFGHIKPGKPEIPNPKSQIRNPNEIPNPKSQQGIETSPKPVRISDFGFRISAAAAVRLVVTESVIEEDMVRHYENKFYGLLRDAETNGDKEIIIDMQACHYVDKSFFVALKRFHTACDTSRTRADVTVECPDYLELWLRKYQIPGKPVPGRSVPLKTGSITV